MFKTRKYYWKKQGQQIFLVSKDVLKHMLSRSELSMVKHGQTVSHDSITIWSE